MHKLDCEICRGRGIIVLPIYRPLSVLNFCSGAISPEAMEPHSRQYPCPECAETVPDENLMVLQSEVSIDHRVPREHHRRIKESAAFALTSKMLESGIIKFEEGPPKAMETPYCATVGVVSPKRVATLEHRIALRQMEVAQEVIKEAQAKIDNWGSCYGHLEILKQDAHRLVGEAINHVLDKRAAIKAA